MKKPLDLRQISDASSELNRPLDTSDDDTAMGHLVRRKRLLLRTATRAIRQLRIDRADLDAEGAVDLAFVELPRSFVQHPEHLINGDKFLKLMTVIIRRIVRDRMRRTGAYKRTGPIGARAAEAETMGDNDVWADRDPISRRRDLDLDQLVSPEPPVYDLIAAKLDLEAFLERLPDELHRAVFILRHQGHSVPAIARRLNVTRRTIERKLKDNRQVYQQWKPGR